MNGNLANTAVQVGQSLAVVAPSKASASVVGVVGPDHYNNGNGPTWSGALLRYYGRDSTGNAYGLPAANLGALVFQNSGAVIATNGQQPIHIAPCGSTNGMTATFTYNGNVGIGTTSPSHKLTVNGTIRAKEVIVESGWADYVFADDYRLAPLSEVEVHIKEHKHLPDMPSAAEVAEKGVSMGEMQAKLLAKVEELTLHVIRMEKENAEQTERIRKLETENAALRNQ